MIISIHLCDQYRIFWKSLNLHEIGCSCPQKKNPINFGGPLTLTVALTFDKTFCHQDLIVTISTVHIHSQEEEEEEEEAGLYCNILFVSFDLQVGMWRRAVQTGCSPTCSSLSLLPRSLPPCSEDDTTSWEAALCRRVSRGSTSSTCLSTPAQTVCYNYRWCRFDGRCQWPQEGCRLYRNSWTFWEIILRYRTIAPVQRPILKNLCSLTVSGNPQ